MADLTEAKVASIPNCDLPHHDPVTGLPRKVLAYADARIPAVGWAYVCKAHFDSYGCSLGMGKGQRLVLDEGAKG